MLHHLCEQKVIVLPKYLRCVMHIAVSVKHI
jgi:hypothetical protein